MINNLYAVLDRQALESVVTDSYDDAGPPKKEESAPTEDKEKGVEPPSSPEHPDGDAKDEDAEEGEEEEGSTDTALDTPSVGPDDAIFDKKFDELTTEEKDFLWSELMATLKSSSLDEKKATEIPAPMQDDKEEVSTDGKPKDKPDGKPEDETNEKPDDKKVEDSKVADEKPEGTVVEDSLVKEKKKKKEKDDAKALVLDSATEPRYPDGTVLDGQSIVHDGGLDIDKLVGKLRRRA
jgi:hypothetical protein